MPRQAIQKGIEEFKKQQKAKARELSRHKKQQAKAKTSHAQNDTNEEVPAGELLIETRQHPLPWLLLAASWGAFLLWYWLG